MLLPLGGYQQPLFAEERHIRHEGDLSAGLSALHQKLLDAEGADVGHWGGQVSVLADLANDRSLEVDISFLEASSIKDNFGSPLVQTTDTVQVGFGHRWWLGSVGLSLGLVALYPYGVSGPPTTSLSKASIYFGRAGVTWEPSIGKGECLIFGLSTQAPGSKQAFEEVEVFTVTLGYRRQLTLR